MFHSTDYTKLKAGIRERTRNGKMGCRLFILIITWNQHQGISDKSIHNCLPWDNNWINLTWCRLSTIRHSVFTVIILKDLTNNRLAPPYQTGYNQSKRDPARAHATENPEIACSDVVLPASLLTSFFHHELYILWFLSEVKGLFDLEVLFISLLSSSWCRWRYCECHLGQILAVYVARSKVWV